MDVRKKNLNLVTCIRNGLEEDPDEVTQQGQGEDEEMLPEVCKLCMTMKKTTATPEEMRILI